MRLFFRAFAAPFLKRTKKASGLAGRLFAIEIRLS